MATRASRDEIRSLAERHQESGLSVAAFCREHGVKSWRLYDFNRRAGRHRTAPQTSLTTFVPVIVEPDRVAPVALAVRVGRHEVIVPRDFDPTDLRRLLEALEAC